MREATVAGQIPTLTFLWLDVVEIWELEVVVCLVMVTSAVHAGAAAVVALFAFVVGRVSYAFVATAVAAFWQVW